MLRPLSTLLILLTSALLVACGADRMSERGFSLPEGNALNGKEAFTYMHCTECHTVAGDVLPTDDQVEPFVELGGQVTRVKSYGELVTSIINPSHRLAQGYPLEVISEEGQSRMPVYNSYMTVQELIDIVAYLQPHYDVYVPPFDYRIYP